MQEEHLNVAYIDIMTESLKQKNKLLEEMIRLTKEQSSLLSSVKLDMEQFQKIINKKTKIMKALTKLDTGFERNYSRLKEELEINKEKYKTEIKMMQQNIVLITDTAVELQLLERQNKNMLDIHLKNKKDDIKTFKVNNRIAQSYYKNMSGQTTGNSYFLDKKQ